ncbi:MAG TPA: hypothetical protein VGF28_15420 [Thermoanaerobaculia bacterium]
MTFYNDKLGDLSVYTPEALMADAQKKVEVLRQLAAEFRTEGARPLTSAEIALANRTPIVFLEKGAVFGEAAPGVGSTDAQIQLLRVTFNADIAYGKVLAEAEELTRQIRQAMLRGKFNAVTFARGLYKVAKSYAQTDLGDGVKGHTQEMGKALTRPRRPEKPEGIETAKKEGASAEVNR